MQVKKRARPKPGLIEVGDGGVSSKKTLTDSAFVVKQGLMMDSRSKIMFAGRSVAAAALARQAALG